jgi:hypothetical protein
MDKPWAWGGGSSRCTFARLALPLPPPPNKLKKLSLSVVTWSAASGGFFLKLTDLGACPEVVLREESWLLPLPLKSSQELPVILGRFLCIPDCAAGSARPLC